MTNNIEPDHKKNPVSKLLTKLTCGALAGISGTILVFPLDLVKTRLQNSKFDVAKGKWPYKGMLDCFRQTLKADGPRGLYRGLIPNLVGITPEKAIKLAVNDYARELLARKNNVAPEKLPIGLGVLAGASAGFCQVIATTPMEIIKIHLQIASTTTPAGCKHPTGLDVIRRLGLRGIYRGTGATLMRDVPFSVVFFPLQAYLKSLCADSDGSVAFPYVFFSGIVAGMAGSAIVTPADVIKTRLQAATTHSHSYMEVARDIYVKQGIPGLFRGVVPRMIVVSPLFGFSILFYETAERYMEHKQ